ncbi:MAG: DUF4760 domain-containing protein [Thermoplasmatota archaeon]
MGIPEALPYIQFFGQMALISAAAFAGYQFLLHRREREENNAVAVLSRIQDAEFRSAYQQIWDLPLHATAEDIRARGPKTEDAVQCVALTFESLGVMVHNRIVDIELVDQIIGGFLRESWRRCEHYVETRRSELGTRRWAEWYQWLAEQLAVDERRKIGAYVAFKDWEA